MKEKENKKWLIGFNCLSIIASFTTRLVWDHSTCTSSLKLQWNKISNAVWGQIIFFQSSRKWFDIRSWDCFASYLLISNDKQYHTDIEFDSSSSGLKSTKLLISSCKIMTKSQSIFTYFTNVKCSSCLSTFTRVKVNKIDSRWHFSLKNLKQN